MHSHRVQLASYTKGVLIVATTILTTCVISGKAYADLSLPSQYISVGEQTDSVSGESNTNNSASYAYDVNGYLLISSGQTILSPTPKVNTSTSSVNMEQNNLNSLLDTPSAYSLTMLLYNFSVTGSNNSTDVQITLSSSLGLKNSLNSNLKYAISTSSASMSVFYENNNNIYGEPDSDVTTELFYRGADLVITNNTDFFGGSAANTRLIADGQDNIFSSLGLYSYYKEYTDTLCVKTNTVYTIQLLAYTSAKDAESSAMADPYISIITPGYNLVLSSGIGNTPPLSANPVPEPATIFLFGAGIIGFAGASRKKNQN